MLERRDSEGEARMTLEEGTASEAKSPEKAKEQSPPGDAASKARPFWVSDRFVQFVDIVFGVVVAQSFARYDWLIANPPSSWFLFSALLTVYITTVLSWIGYHRSMHRYPYEAASFIAWLRMLADLLIVSVYAFLLFSLEPLKEGPATSRLDGYLLGYFAMFVCYLASGFARIWETSDSQASKWTGLLVFALYYLVLVLAYPYALTRLAITAELINWFFLVACPVPYVLYRIWRQPLYAPRS